VGRGTGYVLMYTENNNGQDTFLERAPRQRAERVGELVFNVLWSHVPKRISTTLTFPATSREAAKTNQMKMM
jgi:hypothetical protein